MAKRGFFLSKEIKSLQRAAVAGEPRCVRCGLHRHCSSPKMNVVGRGQKGILFISESPSTSQDRRGDPWAGDATQHLRRTCRQHGVDLEKDCWKINAVSCHTDADHPLTDDHVEWCRPKVFHAIQELKPEKIILLGTIALNSFLSNRWSEGLGGIEKWRGFTIPDRDTRAWVYPTLHPVCAVHAKQDRNAEEVRAVKFAEDMAHALTHDPPEFDWNNEGESQVRVLKDPDDINRAIREYIRANELTAFDYEATGLKPYTPRQKLYSAAMACNSLGAVSFPFYPEIIDRWKLFLRSPVPKTAHQAKFEETWCVAKLAQPVRNWTWCSLMGAHVADNRRGVHGLKFQVYVHFGVMNWGDDINAYLKSGSNDANAVNTIHQANLDQLLMYGGKDALYQLHLAEKQMEALRYDPARYA